MKTAQQAARSLIEDKTGGIRYAVTEDTGGYITLVVLSDDPPAKGEWADDTYRYTGLVYKCTGSAEDIAMCVYQLIREDPEDHAPWVNWNMGDMFKTLAVWREMAELSWTERDAEYMSKEEYIDMYIDSALDDLYCGCMGVDVIHCNNMQFAAKVGFMGEIFLRTLNALCSKDTEEVIQA